MGKRILINTELGGDQHIRRQPECTSLADIAACSRVGIAKKYCSLLHTMQVHYFFLEHHFRFHTAAWKVPELVKFRNTTLMQFWFCYTKSREESKAAQHLGTIRQWKSEVEGQILGQFPAGASATHLVHRQAFTGWQGREPDLGRSGPPQQRLPKCFKFANCA